MTKAQKRVVNGNILALHMRGYTVETIVEKMANPKVTRGYVIKAIPEMLDQEAERLATISSRIIVSQLGRLEKLGEELSIEWQKSRGTRVTTVKGRRDKGTNLPKFQPSTGAGNTNGQGSSSESELSGDFEQTIRMEETTGIGDPRLAQQLREVYAEQRMLLGLTKPEAIQAAINNLNINITVNEANAHEKDILPHTPAQMVEMVSMMESMGMNLDGTPIKYLPASEEYTEAEFYEPGAGEQADDESETDDI